MSGSGSGHAWSKVTLDAATRTINFQEDRNNRERSGITYTVTSCINDSAGTCNSDYSFSYSSYTSCLNMSVDAPKVYDWGTNEPPHIDLGVGNAQTLYVPAPLNSVAPAEDPNRCTAMTLELSTNSNGDAGNEPNHNWASFGSADANG